jgi:hypothetical protein
MREKSVLEFGLESLLSLESGVKVSALERQKRKISMIA